MAMARNEQLARHSHYATKAWKVFCFLLWLIKIIVMGAAAAIAALYKQLKLLLLTINPNNQQDLESDRAGRAAELKVASLGSKWHPFRIFTFANENGFEGIPGVQVYTSLRIPDSGRRGRREIDLVLLTKRELFVVEVKNWSGMIQLSPADGSWVQIRRNGTTQKHSNVVDETILRAQLMESYIEKRGVTVPSGFVQPKVFLVNPDCRPEQAIVMQKEVLSADQWEHFMENSLGRTNSGWLSTLFNSQKSVPVLSDSAEKQLHYILSTAPTWDRLELDGGKIVVGDFQSFQGQLKDRETLKVATRSAVKVLAMTHRRGWASHVIGFMVGRTPKVQIELTARDHREVNIAKPSKKQDTGLPRRIEVRPDSEIVFQPVANPQSLRYNINDVISLTLSS